MKYNFSGIRKAEAPNSAAAFNFSGIAKKDQAEEMQSTAELFGIGDQSRRAPEGQRPVYLQNLLRAARRGSALQPRDLKDLKDSYIGNTDVTDIGDAASELSQTVLPPVEVTAAAPMQRDPAAIAQTLPQAPSVRTPSTPTELKALDVAQIPDYLMNSGLLTANLGPLVSGAGDAAKRVREGVDKMRSRPVTQTPIAPIPDPEGMSDLLVGMLRGYFTGATPGSPFLTGLGITQEVTSQTPELEPLQKMIDVTMAPVRTFSDAPKNRMEENLIELGDLVVPLAAEKAGGAAMEKMRELRQNNMRARIEQLRSELAKAPEQEQATPKDEAPLQSEAPLPAEPLVMMKPDATPEYNFDGIRKNNEPPAADAAVIPDQPPVPDAPAGALPVIDLDKRGKGGGRRKYDDADEMNFPLLNYMVREHRKIAPEMIVDRITGKRRPIGEYDYTPRVFMAQGKEPGEPLSRIVEGYNEMLPEDGNRLDGYGFLDALYAELDRYDRKAAKPQGAEVYGNIPKAERISLSALDEQQRGQYKELAEMVAGMVAYKYGWHKDPAKLNEAVQGIMQGEGAELKRLPQQLMQEIRDAITLDGVAYDHEGGSDFVQLDALRRVNEQLKADEAARPKLTDEERRRIEEEANTPAFIAASATLGAGALAQHLMNDEDNKWTAGSGLVALAALAAPGKGKRKGIEPSEKNLVTLHNISGKKLLFADEMGGLALPSLAITKKDGNFEGFGDISLVGKPELIDPKRKGNKVVDTDMYSPRYPNAKYDLDRKKVIPIAQAARENWLKHYSKKDLPEHRRSNVFNENRGYAVEGYDSYASSLAESIGDDGPGRLYSDEVMIALYLKENGAEMPKTADGLREAIYGQTEAFDEWLTEKFSPAITRKKFFKGFTNMGNKRWTDYTLDNVIKDMRSRMKEGEGFSYGAGNVRAAGAKKFKSIADIQKNRDRLVSEGEMEAVKKEMNDELIRLAELYKPNYQYQSNAFGYYDEFAGALREGQKSGLRSKMKEYGFEIEDFTPIYNYLEMLRNTPAEYFEAKPQRGVQLGEFAAAIIPNTTSKKVRDVLAKNGIEQLEEYDPNIKTSRSEALARLTQRIPDLLFATAGAGLIGGAAAAASSDDKEMKNIGGMMTAAVIGGAVPGFYRKLERTIADRPQGRYSPAQLRAMLKKGEVKAEEWKWSGMDDLLEQAKAKGGSISKADILKHLQENAVEVREVVKDDKAAPFNEEQQRQFNQLLQKYDNLGFDTPAEARGAIVEHADWPTRWDVTDVPELVVMGNDYRNRQLGNKVMQTKYSGYQLPGGKDYRELLLTMPINPSMPLDEYIQTYRRNYPQTRATDEMIREGWQSGDEVGRGPGHEIKRDPNVYKSSHWEEPNILAHIRFNDRTVDGQRVLFIEEVQSDWHQAGRKKGYKGEPLQYGSRIEGYIPVGYSWEKTVRPGIGHVIHQLVRDNDKTVVSEGMDRVEALRKSGLSPTIPDAPFKTTWHDLAMKRMIRWAAENGYDRIAWTTGEQQAARYDLSKEINQVSWDDNEASFDPAKMEGDPTPGTLTAYDKAGKRIINKRMTPDEIENYIGKEATKKLLEQQPFETHGNVNNFRTRTLENADLKFGGEGMKGFYDKMLPDWARKYGKKWGAKVDQLDIPDGKNKKELNYILQYNLGKIDAIDKVTGETVKTFDTEADARKFAEKESTIPVHSMQITPEMKKSVMTEGQALFTAAAAGVGLAGAQLLMGEDDQEPGIGTMAAGVALSGAVGRMTPKLRDTFNAMQRHVRGRYALGEIKPHELGTALREVVKEYMEKGEGRFLAKDERALLLQASGSWNAKQQAKEAGRNYKLQNEIMQYARSIEPKWQDLTDPATGEATSTKRSMVEAGWVTQGMWENIKDRVIDEINRNPLYRNLGKEGKAELFKAVEKNYQYHIKRSNDAIFENQLGLGQTPAQGIYGDMPYDRYKDVNRLDIGCNTMDRMFEKYFGKDYGTAKRAFLDPLDDAKAKHTEMQVALINELQEKIIKKLRIKKGSKESRAVQNLGEGARFVEVSLPKEVLTALNEKVQPEQKTGYLPRAEYQAQQLKAKMAKLNEWVTGRYGANAKVKEDKGPRIVVEIPVTYQDIVNEFGPDRAADIQAAVNYFREKYDDLLSRVNVTRAKIYPGNPDKIIRKRKDYFRHFWELSDGLGGLLNVFEQPILIDPKLVGISAETLPKSKWASFMQSRFGNMTAEDAVGGYLNYIPNASYAMHIDPQINRFRGLAETIAEATQKTKSSNGFIEALRDYANNLAGKTNDFDRAVMKVTGRTALRSLNRLNNRVKTNTILLNASSSLAQAFNIPQGIASAKQHAAKGAVDTFADLLGEKQSDKSKFIRERYIDRKYGQFDSGVLSNAKRFARWFTSVFDEVGTRYIWNSHYRKAIAEGKAETDAIRYADNTTRRLVAGRGIGETPYMQQSNLMQVVMPFQLEVANLWLVQKDMLKARDFAGLAILAVASYAMNRGAEEIKGEGVTFDPIQALIDAIHTYQNEDNAAMGLAKAAGRLSGEVLSNVPLGQTIAGGLYPEMGAKDVLGTGIDLPTRKQLFGREDPTRFGTGLIALKGLQDPLYKILPPFGGNQLKKTKAAIDAIREGGIYKPSGKFIEITDDEYLRALLFGPNSTESAQEFYNRRNQ